MVATATQMCRSCPLPRGWCGGGRGRGRGQGRCVDVARSSAAAVFALPLGRHRSCPRIATPFLRAGQPVFERFREGTRHGAPAGAERRTGDTQRGRCGAVVDGWGGAAGPGARRFRRPAAPATRERVAPRAACCPALRRRLHHHLLLRRRARRVHAAAATVAAPAATPTGRATPHSAGALPSPFLRAQQGPPPRTETLPASSAPVPRRGWRLLPHDSHLQPARARERVRSAQRHVHDGQHGKRGAEPAAQPQRAQYVRTPATFTSSTGKRRWACGRRGGDDGSGDHRGVTPQACRSPPQFGGALRLRRTPGASPRAHGQFGGALRLRRTPGASPRAHRGQHDDQEGSSRWTVGFDTGLTSNCSCSVEPTPKVGP
jgi:hypothetical protein